jgi:predicted O-methyltransferase YrrM
LYTKLQLAKKFLHYYATAGNGKGHGMHSPFVFNFITKVLHKKEELPDYRSVEQLRNALLKNRTVIEIEDFGAGSTTTKSNQRSIGSITKNAAKPKKYAQLLFRIVQYYTCQNIIELGTSLGMSTSYMALGNPFARVITCEGSTTIAKKAKENFEKLFIENITVFTGEFAKSYTQALQEMPNIDLLFIDGNHQYQPTIDYFEKALPHIQEHSIVIFDDIHWSSDMEKAWERVKQYPGISETIDLFFIGIVFFRKEQLAKQDFTIRF